MSDRISLELLEKEQFKPGASPYEAPALPLLPQKENPVLSGTVQTVSLNGMYQMAADGEDESRLPENAVWEDAVEANVPCTVATALYEAGKIPDPMFGKNDAYAREAAYRTWWFRKKIDYDGSMANPHLIFEGVCHEADFWLNDVYLGHHVGMFAGPEFAVKDILKAHNTLTVKIANSPADRKHYSPYADYDDGWKNGVVLNCVYGWHYASIPSRGIWQGVTLADKPRLSVERPFLFTEDYRTGRVGLCLTVSGKAKGKIGISVKPKNFEGKEDYFSAGFMTEDKTTLHYPFSVSDFRLWWPNGYGEQPLYQIEISVCAENDLIQHFTETLGIRQIEMRPAAEPRTEEEKAWRNAAYSEDQKQPDAKQYNWQTVINGKPIFIKGTNWCTLDALLRFPNERYDRFLTLAKGQNLQLLRAWGGGMPESDYSYNKCDELGLLVQQEWPTCWDSPKTQPYDALCETVIAHTVRLRNHPSLVRWAGGNELTAFHEPIVPKMGALAWELDGTRPYHRTSPCAGSRHDYGTYWDKKDMDHSLSLNAVFIGEFGMASFPNIESVARYVPKEEMEQFDPIAKSALTYHTPRFNECAELIDMEHLMKRAKEFWTIETTKDLIETTQLAQAVCLRHVIESQRAAAPVATGVCYYKLTDVYPAASWSTVDYYGVPKLSYYVVQNAFAPVHIMLSFRSIGATEAYPLIVLDDRLALSGKSCAAIVTGYNRSLQPLFERKVDFVPNEQVNRLASVRLTKEEQEDILIFSLTLLCEEKTIDQTFYFVNYAKTPGVLKQLPATQIEATVKDDVILKNTGVVPAVGVMIECPAEDTVFTASENYLLLAPGEEKRIKVNVKHNLRITGLNMKNGVEL